MAARKIHVLTRRQELDDARLAGKVAIVLDVLFATTTIVTALAHGARAVLPVTDGRAAVDAAKGFADAERVLAGEHMAVTIEGFATPLPQGLVAHGVKDRTVIYSTTNGTVALNGVQGADHVYAAALVNGEAAIDHVVRRHPQSTVLVVCSGSLANVNVEDMYGAGYLVDRFAARVGDAADLSDAARVALALYRHAGPQESLADCRVGRQCIERGDAHEVAHAAQLSVYDLVAEMRDGLVTRVPRRS